MSRIAIFGGHGKVAMLTHPLLVEAGHEVSAIIRDPDQSDEVAATGATPVVADVETMSTEQISDLLAGHDAVVWSAGAGGGSPERTRAVDQDAAIRSMEAARTAGARRYVMVSYLGAGPDHGVPQDDPFWHYAQAKAAADSHLKATDLAWTILGPSGLTLAEPTGRISVSDTRGEVSRGNVARVIAAVLDGPEVAVGRVIEFVDGDTPIAEVVAG